MRFVRTVSPLIIPSIIILLFAGQLFWLQQTWVGVTLFLIYLFFVGQWWKKIYRHGFGMRLREWMTSLLSYGSTIVLLSLIAAIFVSWYRLTPATIVWIFTVTTAISYCLKLYVCSKRHWQPKKLPIGKGFSYFIFPKNVGLLAAYAIFWIVSFYLLYISKSGDVLQSPWQTIHPLYVPAYFFLTVILGVLIFSKYSTKFILGLVVAHSFLLHAYLPLSHQLPWGGDVWRHIGVEEHLAAGKPALPVLFGSDVAYREYGPIIVPEVLITPQKYTYTQLWGLSVVLHKILNISLLQVNIWLVPILWTILVPILIFRITAALFGSWRGGLAFSALTSLAFPFQALGALSLPVSLGYITFFLAVMLWLHAMRTHNRMQYGIAFGLGLLMIFGYPLHAVLFWFIAAVHVCIHFLATSSRSLIKYGGLSLLFIGSCLIIPIFEILSGVTFIPDSFPPLSVFKQVIGQFSGWYFASDIRPHDIYSGNIVFNHVPAGAFVDTVFLQWRWMFVVLMILLFTLAGYTLYNSLVLRQRIWIHWAIVILGSFGGYTISWFLLDGEKLFARRLDLFLSFGLLLFALRGLTLLGLSISKLWITRLISMVGIIVIAWLGTATYTSGPDLRVASEDEFSAAAHVWQETNKSAASHCVIADTWPLLVLEAQSARKVIGGGFPINKQFGQPDRVRIFNTMVVSPSKEILQQSHTLTGVTQCWVLLPGTYIGKDVIEQVNSLMHTDVSEVGSLYLWYEQTTSTLESLVNIQ